MAVETFSIWLPSASGDLLGWVTSSQIQSITGGFVLSHVLYNTLGINNKLGVHWNQISVKWFSGWVFLSYLLEKSSELIEYLSLIAMSIAIVTFSFNSTYCLIENEISTWVCCIWLTIQLKITILNWNMVMVKFSSDMLLKCTIRLAFHTLQVNPSWSVHSISGICDYTIPFYSQCHVLSNIECTKQLHCLQSLSLSFCCSFISLYCYAYK